MYNDINVTDFHLLSSYVLYLCLTIFLCTKYGMSGMSLSDAYFVLLDNMRLFTCKRIFLKGMDGWSLRTRQVKFNKEDYEISVKHLPMKPSNVQYCEHVNDVDTKKSSNSLFENLFFSFFWKPSTSKPYLDIDMILIDHAFNWDRKRIELRTLEMSSSWFARCARQWTHEYVLWHLLGR